MINLASSMADILTAYSAPVKPGDYVTIIGNIQTSHALIEALCEAVLKRGGYPNVQSGALISADYTPYFELFMREASDDQIDTLDRTMMYWVEQSDVLFFIKAPNNTKALSAIDPARIGRYRKTQKPVSETYLGRYDAGELKWVVVGWPTQALAQSAEMGLLAYEEFVARACGLDQPDPIAYWQGFRAMQERLVAWLADKSFAEVRGPGIEMSFNFGGRKWVSCHGELNFPDGEIFTSPVEDSVNGYVHFNYPSVYLGNEVDGVKLRFENGEAVEMSATKNEKYVISQLTVDPGARRLGEFAIGTNMGVQQLTRSILFDEKIGGSIHMALGRSYEEALGLNQSAIHWDMVHNMKDGGEIIIDGIPFYRAGEFLV
ncbi:MAG: aminopeptidase [Anaerolineae bacterium]|nr:aminopeptidase [Anaerolineae bacterium]